MFSYIYMKILESKPGRYDRGISWLSFGRADKQKKEIADRAVRAGDKVLDIGAGTGTLALLCAERDAEVIGMDASAAMLAVAEQKRKAHPKGGQVHFVEAGVAEMDTAFEQGAFDVATASLVFSELSEDEQRYALAQAHRVLKSEGRLVVADETRPQGFFRRILYHLVRFPLALITFLFTQTTTRPVTDLEKKVSEAGFDIEKVERRNLRSFFILYATKR